MSLVPRDIFERHNRICPSNLSLSLFLSLGTFSIIFLSLYI
nr:MAG TPA: hypothetical protein [Caudoviricetes sp.]